jgi:hypothetical protein
MDNSGPVWPVQTPSVARRERSSPIQFDGACDLALVNVHCAQCGNIKDSPSMGRICVQREAEIIANDSWRTAFSNFQSQYAQIDLGTRGDTDIQQRLVSEADGRNSDRMRVPFRVHTTRRSPRNSCASRRVTRRPDGIRVGAPRGTAAVRAGEATDSTMPPSAEWVRLS